VLQKPEKKGPYSGLYAVGVSTRNISAFFEAIYRAFYLQLAKVFPAFARSFRNKRSSCGKGP